MFSLLKNFFKDPWNTFDFITVIGSIIDALVVEIGVRYFSILFQNSADAYLCLSLNLQTFSKNVFILLKSRKECNFFFKFTFIVYV